MELHDQHHQNLLQIFIASSHDRFVKAGFFLINDQASPKRHDQAQIKTYVAVLILYCEPTEKLKHTQVN